MQAIRLNYTAEAFVEAIAKSISSSSGKYAIASGQTLAASKTLVIPHHLGTKKVVAIAWREETNGAVRLPGSGIIYAVSVFNVAGITNEQGFLEDWSSPLFTRMVFDPDAEYRYDYTDYRSANNFARSGCPTGYGKDTYRTLSNRVQWAVDDDNLTILFGNNEYVVNVIWNWRVLGIL